MEALLIVIVVALLAALAVGGWFLYRERRSRSLRERFGPEYGHAVAEFGGRRRAESELEARQKRVEQLHIVSLDPAAAQAFSQRWRDAQARFVDEPSRAIRDADALVLEVMQQRGYPMEDFEQRAADVSVDHPQVVADYRAARAIAVANEDGRAETEDLRQAMVHYRSLFEELLREPTPDREHRQRTGDRHDVRSR